MRGIRHPARNPVPHYTRVWVSMSVLNPVSESELLLVTRSNDNHSPGPVMREVSP